MLKVDKNIFYYLQDKNISLETKEAIVNKNKNKINKLVSELWFEEKIKYLFTKQIPNNLKEIICEDLDNSEIYLSYDKNEYLKKYILANNLLEEKTLYKKYCPLMVKQIIIPNFYTKNIKQLILDNSISINTKKVIIDVNNNEEDFIYLLKQDIPKELINYIIDNKIKTTEQIKKYLSMFSKIPKEIKEKIIIKKITANNLLEVLNTVLFSEEEINRIFNLAHNEVVKFINDINSKTILKILSAYKMKQPLAEKIVEYRKNDVEKAVSKLNKKNVGVYLLNSKSVKLTEIILENKKKQILNSVNKIPQYNLLIWLNKEYITPDIKEYIIIKREKDLEKEIKKLNPSEIKLYYLTKDSNLPISVQEKIFELTKQLFIDEIEKYTETELIETIIYGTTSNSIKKIMIEKGINKINIFNFLYQLEHHLEVAKMTIDLKKEILQSKLKELDVKDIFNLNNIKASEEIKNLIIQSNKEIVLEKLKNLKKEDIFNYVSGRNSLFSVKEIVLEYFGIYNTGLINYLYYVNPEKCELLINNYNIIKEFFSSVNIDFESFLQYGSGSKKYNNWLINLINIIYDNKISEFNNVKKYFFDNYYDDFEKENTVYLISNFMELLENFCNNYELCINLTNSNKILTKDDKTNIKFLFNLRNLDNKKLPKNLEEINDFKFNLYNTYIEKINKEDISIFELQQIFNSLIFGKSDLILSNIEGTRGLKTLKKDNERSSSISNLIDELLLYANIIEEVNNTNNKEGLIRALNYIFKDNLNNLTKIQNIFSQFQKKVLKLYEMDSQINLTKLENVKNIEGVINEELSLKYGGEVYDFSDKNYILYGHTLSSKENIEDLLNGNSTGESNFISVSPISYMGQKYYYNINNLILAFDKIPTGSFICSSISNMGTNYRINNNSSEIDDFNRQQRGILETSAVTENNSETLLYREGLKACGIILPGGRVPNKIELEYHKKYNLPFILTQENNKPIDCPKKIFDIYDSENKTDNSIEELRKIINVLKPNIIINKETDKYTGREVALFTDCHSMYEPTAAVLDDINKRGITEIYSLGDNVGLGPNPEDVFDLLEDYDVKSVAGNSEYYNTIGLEPFNYFYPEKIKSQEWTFEKLGTHRINKLKLYPPSLDIIVGNKKVALCHFANDVRWDYVNNSTWTYQANFDSGNASKQFLNTNSEEAKKLIENYIVSHKGDKRANGFISAKNSPLFDGKIITDYDSIIQGHVHFEMNDKLNNTNIHTLRAVGMGYMDNSEDMACYYILKERKDGNFDIEKKLVDYNKNSLISNIYTCGIPEKEKVLSFIKGK